MNILEKLKITKLDIKILILTFIVLGSAFCVFENTSVETARSLDIRFGFYAVFSTFLIAVLGFLINGFDLFKKLKARKITGSVIAVGIISLCLFTVFIFSNISNTHRVLSDETSWESMAFQMYFSHSGGVCNEGFWKNGILDCQVEVNNFKGKTLALLESFAYSLKAPGRDTALQVNFPLYILSLIAFFLALSRWFKSDKLALAASLFLAGMPIFMMQSRSASTEVLYVFLLSFLMLVYALIPPKEIRWKHFVLIVPVLGLFAGTRQETVFAFIPFALYYVSYFREKIYRLPLFVLSVIFVSYPSINTMAAYRGYDFQGGEHAAHSLANFLFNIKSNILIMLNFENGENQHILANPFYSSFTIILLLATIWLLWRCIFCKKYRRGALLGILFCLQIFVILLNVSGTFEIDINQRYVLVALPLFAIIMALGISDALQVFFKMPFKQANFLTALFAFILSFGLAVFHAGSFKANMLYHNNKLLSEEDFLNTTLASYPENSVFVYARPWQMLASLHSSISERTFLNLNDEQFANLMDKSGGNIYLVRGQDGRGVVNTKSRVVGFKTTSQIEQIYENFKTENILTEKHLFGYPLVIDRITGKRGLSKYRQGISISTYENNRFVLKKNFSESVAYKLYEKEVFKDSFVLSENNDTLILDSLDFGLTEWKFEFVLPDNDTLFVFRDFFQKAENVSLVSSWKVASYTQEWGNLEINKSVEHNTLTIGKRPFVYGFGTHASAQILLDIPENFRNQKVTLFGKVGLDDESVCGDGISVVIRSDAQEIFRSRHLYTEETENFRTQLTLSENLELLVHPGENKDCDHANFVNLWVLKE